MDFNGAAEQSCVPTDQRMIRKSAQRFSVLSKYADIALSAARVQQHSLGKVTGQAAASSTEETAGKVRRRLAKGHWGRPGARVRPFSQPAGNLAVSPSLPVSLGWLGHQAMLAPPRTGSNPAIGQRG